MAEGISMGHQKSIEILECPPSCIGNMLVANKSMTNMGILWDIGRELCVASKHSD